MTARMITATSRRAQVEVISIAFAGTITHESKKTLVNTQQTFFFFVLCSSFIQYVFTFLHSRNLYSQNISSHNSLVSKILLPPEEPCVLSTNWADSASFSMVVGVEEEEGRREEADVGGMFWVVFAALEGDSVCPE